MYIAIKILTVIVYLIKLMY